MTPTKAIKNLRKNNPYPADIFTEPTKAQWDKVTKVLKRNNISSDAVFGSWGRRVWNMCIEDFEKLIKSNPSNPK